MTIRSNLRKARKRKNLTQKQTADVIGVTDRQYQHIEAGTRGTSESNWLKLFDLFERSVPLNELMETDEPSKLSGAGGSVPQ